MAIFYKPGGGTDLPSGTAGDLLYFDGSAWASFPLGSADELLASTGTALDWTSLAAIYQPLDPDLTAIAALSGTGVAVRTASNTWTTRSVVSSSAALTVTNGSGASGNITLDLDSDLTAIAALSGSSVIPYRLSAGSWTTLSPSTIGLDILGAADAAAVKTLLSIPATVGDVTGPGSSTDNGVPRFNGTGGKTLQASLLVIDNTGVASGLTGLFVGPMDTMVVAGTTVSSRIHAHYESDAADLAEIELHRIATGAARAATIYGARAQVGETAVASGNRLFQMVALGHDGTDYAIAGRIYCEVNGTVGANQVPGMWGFSTADASGTVAERAYISADGLFLETPLAVTEGGTGAADAATARTNLGLAIGTNVQAYSATLAAVAAGTWTGATSITTLGTIGTGTWQGTPVGLSYGGTGQTSAAAAFNALKQDATTSASGVAEVATYLEGQTAGSVRVEDAREAHNLYRSGFYGWGLVNASPFDNNFEGNGVLSVTTGTGTFTGFMDATAGAYLTFPTSTSTARGIYAGDGVGGLEWPYAGHLRYVFRFGGNSTFRIYGGLCPWGGTANMVAAETSTAAVIRFGIDAGTIRAICADGVARTKQDFTTSPGASTIYEWEIIPNRAMTSVVFNLYSYTSTGGRGALLETKTITGNIPSTAVKVVPLVWTIATSGTPTAYWHSMECVGNIV